MKSKSKQIWVSPNQGNGWKVHRPGSLRACAKPETKQKAIKIAISIAKNQGLETKIQKKNGTIQGGNSYGNDPCPPIDRQ